MSDAVPTWRQFFMRLDGAEPDTVEDVFMRFGAKSVTFVDAGNDPVLEPGPGEAPLWTDTQIIGLFSADADMRSLLETLRAELGVTDLPANRTEVLVDRDWEREWRKDFGPMRFGRRLWICPSCSKVAQSDAVIVRLDPGLAFGTGTHPTTALCLEWLDGLSPDGKTMLDYGCGSGVLAIAALKLGCQSATALDIDPQALIASRRNAVANGVADALCIVGDAGNVSGVFDVVVANILAEPLIEFAESITLTLVSHGMLALSGVLCEQAGDVMAAFEPWIDFDEAVYREHDGQTWSRLTGNRI